MAGPNVVPLTNLEAETLTRLMTALARVSNDVLQMLVDHQGQLVALASQMNAPVEGVELESALFALYQGEQVRREGR